MTFPPRVSPGTGETFPDTAESSPLSLPGGATMTVMTAKHKRLSAAWGLFTENPALLGVAGIGFAVSFQTIRRVAVEQHMPGWPVLYPLGIDVGILALIVESRKAIDAGRSDFVPRFLAWVLAGLTIYVNAHGAPAHDWLGITLHVVMPALWIVFLELTRWRRLAKRAAEKGDPIPLSRWLLAPWRTAWLRRNMILWGETSYKTAVNRQAVILYATALAQADKHIGRTPFLWRRRLPVTLRWQLAEGKPPESVELALGTLSYGGVETWQEPASAWVDAELEMLPRSVTRVTSQGTSQGTGEVTGEGSPQGTGEGTPGVTAQGRRPGTSRGSEWPESRTVDRAVLVRRTKAAIRRWEEKHPGQRLPATQLGAQLKLRMSRDTATSLLSEARDDKPRLHVAEG
jgi:Protein of unknown function (DUF2637)